MWWRCAQYFVIVSCGYMPKRQYNMAHVGFLSVVVTVWGSVEMFVVYRC